MQPELDAARDCYYAIRALVRHHPDGSRNEKALATLRALCRSVGLSVPDAECRAALQSIEELACPLFTACEGPAWVRRQLLRELEWFRASLLAFESARDQAVARAPRARTSHTSLAISAAPTAAPTTSVMTAPGNAPAGMSESRPETPKATRRPAESGRMK